MKALESILQNQTFIGKIIIIFCLTMVPLICLIGYLLYTSILDYQTRSLAHEGIQYLEKSHALAENIAIHRGKTNVYINSGSSNTNLVTELKALEVKVDGIIESLLSMSISKPIEKPLGSIKNYFQALKIDSLKASQNKVAWYTGYASNIPFAAHSELINEVIDLHSSVSSISNLSALPEKPISIMRDFYLTKLPNLLNDIGITRGVASGVAAKGEFTPDSYTNLISKMDTLNRDFVLAKTRVGFLKGEFESALFDQINASFTSTENYSRYVRNQIVQPDKINVDSGAVFSKGTNVIGEWAQVRSSVQNFLTSAVNQSIQHTKNVLWATGFATAFTLFFGLLSIKSFYSVTVNSILELQNVFKALAHGNLNAKASINGTDEMAKMAQELNKMSAQFKNSIQEVADNFLNVQTAAHSIKNNMDMTSDSITEQAQQMESIASAMTEMTASAQEVERNTQQASQEATGVVNTTNNGDKIMQVMVNSISDLTNGVRSTSAAISALDEDTKAIGKVTEVIRDIAEQTNLLALNAAIEAARAGEQGRGFAVVADEVRGLAQRTRESTDEIQTTIAKLQKASDHAVSVISRSMGNADDTRNQVSEVQGSLSEIRSSVSDMTSMNEHIASAATQQASTTNEMNASISRVQTLSHEADERVQQVNNLAEQLAQATETLSQNLKFYKI